MSKESSRRDLSKTALFGIGTLLVVEQSRLESQSMGCVKTVNADTYGAFHGPDLRLIFAFFFNSLAQSIAGHIQKRNTEIITAEMRKILCFIFVF